MNKLNICNNIHLLQLTDEQTRGDTQAYFKSNVKGDFVLISEVTTVTDLYYKVFSEKTLTYDGLVISVIEPNETLKQFLICLSLQAPSLPVYILGRSPLDFYDFNSHQNQLTIHSLPKGDIGLFQLHKLVAKHAMDTTKIKKNCVSIPTSSRERQIEDDLSWIQKRYELLLNEAGEGIVGLDSEGRITFANPTAGQIFGTPHSSLINQKLTDFTLDSPLKDGSTADTFTKDRRRVGRGLINKANNELLYVEYTQSFVGNNSEDETVSIMIIEDISERIKFEAKLRKLAHEDVLTGLYNRYYFEKSLKKELTNRRIPEPELAVALIDLDNFKNINDLYGHNIGDKLLIQFSKRLREHVRRSDLVARLGGDEFIILLKNTTTDKAQEITEKININLRSPFIIDGKTLQISASIGITEAKPNDNIEDILARADHAMYSIKYNGKDGTATAPT